jgi:hypothetical protein
MFEFTMWHASLKLRRYTALGKQLLISNNKNRVRCAVLGRVSFETSFDSNQPKLEPKLVSALSETKRLFRLFRFYSETASFGVSVKPKLTKTNRNQPKQAENSGLLLQHFVPETVCPTSSCPVLDVSVLLPLDLLVSALSSLCCFFVSL